VSDTLKALESKFLYKLRELREDLELKITAMRKFNREQLKKTDKRLTALEDGVSKEIEDRIKESDE
jgi:hypothetical protein